MTVLNYPRITFFTTDNTDFPDKKASSLCHLCNPWFLFFS